MGIGKRIKKFVAGDSKADIQAREARLKELRLQHDEYMAKAKAQREDDRKIATDALQRARDHEIKLKKLKADAAGELNKNKDQLAKAKANLAKTETTLKRLGAKKMELVGRMQCHLGVQRLLQNEKTKALTPATRKTHWKYWRSPAGSWASSRGTSLTSSSSSRIF